MARTTPNMWKRAHDLEVGLLRRVDGEPGLQMVEAPPCRSAENIPEDVQAVLRSEAIREAHRQQERERARQHRNRTKDSIGDPISKTSTIIQVGGNVVFQRMRRGCTRRQLRTWKVR